ncbi:hypothetical protein HAX54_018047 [Datura stramonium]|uniref:RING-type domain-containing protein n=1 Tax=Datura stramonium TaxID=4076 RepID=A0ABS8S0Z0_DATST|nr:hypothetical protein [Datura stramonium]
MRRKKKRKKKRRKSRLLMMYPSRFLMKLKKRKRKRKRRLRMMYPIRSLDVEIREEEEDEFENDLYEWILDEEIMAEAEEFENDLSEWILDEEIMVEEEEFENDVSALILDEGLDEEIIEEGFEARMARMRVNTDYVHYRMQVPQSIEEEAEEEDDTHEVLDQDMSEYLKTRTFCAVDTNNFNEVEEQEACAICLFDYQDKDTIGTLQCGHEFHAECINKWLQRNTSCPFCRGPVLPTTT